MEQMPPGFVLILDFCPSRFLWTCILAVPIRSYVPGLAKVFI